MAPNHFRGGSLFLLQEQPCSMCGIPEVPQWRSILRGGGAKGRGSHQQIAKHAWFPVLPGWLPFAQKKSEAADSAENGGGTSGLRLSKGR